MKKKVFGIVLSLMLVVAMLPTMAFAETNSVYTLNVSVTDDVNGGYVQIGNGAIGSITSESNISAGESRTVNIYPADSYEIDSVKVNDSVVSVTDNSITVGMNGNKNVEVKFKKKTQVSFQYNKTVEGNNAPTNQPFQFELLRVVDDARGNRNFEVINTTGPVPAEDGVLRGTWTIFVSESDLEKLAFREKQESILGWTYDDTVYYVDISPNNVDQFNIIMAKYTKLGDQSNTTYDRAEFVNTYSAYDMDGVYHWPLEDEQDKEEHKDVDSDGHCDVCDYDMSDNNGNTTPTDPTNPSQPTDGSTTPTVNNTDKAAKTGDDSNMALWIALMAIAAVLGTGTVLYRRKNTVK